MWAAAESRALLGIRGLVAREWSIPKSHTDITGYWHVRDEPATDASETTAQPRGNATSFTPIASPVPWLATRAAIGLGLLDAVAAGPRSRSDLARAVNVSAAKLNPLLDILSDCGVMTQTDDAIAVGSVGEQFLEDEHAREEFEGVNADQILALGGLAQALSSGQSAWARYSGQSLRERVASSSDDYAELVEESEGLVFLMPALAGLRQWARYSRIAVSGPASLVIADGLRTGGVAADVVIVEEREPLAALRNENPPAGVEFAESWEGTDAVLLGYACEHRTDEEIIEHLTQLLDVTTAVYLVEPTDADALNTHARERALMHVGTVGVAPRDASDLSRLAHAAGWSITSTAALGWGVECLELSPGQHN